ncbi:hypothetical protein GOODEAATRI_003323 [Goodea atripinnis]|uniref:Uncharacterized protein n=1 Tax=Goodea atripinnis TaxID=208336 RepID=A0ABV0NH39_9TELE
MQDNLSLRLECSWEEEESDERDVDGAVDRLPFMPPVSATLTGVGVIGQENGNTLESFPVFYRKAFLLQGNNIATNAGAQESDQNLKYIVKEIE